MQYNERPEIKGDFEVDARGSSVLLVRELQSQNLGVIATQATTHPVLGPMTKAADAYRKWVQTMMVPADEVVKDDEEIAAAQQKQAEQTPPEVQEKQLEMQMQQQEWNARLQQTQMDNQTKLQVAQIERDTAMMKLAQDSNVALDKIQAQLQSTQINAQKDLAKTEMQTNSSERQFAAEVAVEERKDARARAMGGDPANNAGGSV
jgi:hypothetical protein